MKVVPKSKRSGLEVVVLDLFSSCGPGPSDCSRKAGWVHADRRSWMRIVVLSTLVAIICSMDRTAMSIAIIPMSQQHGWSDSVKGAVSSSFNLGHTITNLVGGALAATISPKLVLSSGVVVWSLFTILTPPSAHWLPLLYLVRMVMGLGEGVAYPTLQAVIKGWVPADKRSRALGLIYSGHQVGSILSLLIAPFIIQSLGTPWLFYVFGSLGFLWLALWDPLVPPGMPPAASGHGQSGASSSSAPPDGDESSTSLLLEQAGSGAPHGSHQAPGSLSIPAGGSEGGQGPGADKGLGVVAHGGQAAAAYAHMSGAPGAVVAQLWATRFGFKGLPWRSFLTNRVFWAILCAHSCFGIGYNVCIAWLPTYYAQNFGLDVKQSSMLSVLPWLVMAIGTNVSGWVADALINARVLTTTKTRKMMQLIGNLGPGLCLFYLALVPQKGYLAEALMLLTMCMATLGMQSGGFASCHTDISTKHASVLFGITNAGASLAGSVVVYLVGVILDTTGSWSLVFQIVACANFFTAFVFVTLASSEPQFD